MKHGIASAYRHGCRCDECTAAHSIDCAARFATYRTAPKDPDDSRHGTLAFYANHGCRCEPCRAAKSISNAKRKGAW